MVMIMVLVILEMESCSLNDASAVESCLHKQAVY